MITVNFNNGSTLSFDLNKEDDLKQWKEWCEVTDFQERIRGIGILHDKRFYNVKFDEGCRRNAEQFKMVRFKAETLFNHKNDIQRKLGEKLTVFTDVMKIEYVVYTYPDPIVASSVNLIPLTGASLSVADEGARNDCA